MSMTEKVMNEPIMPTLKNLQKGEAASFDLDRLASVRSICALLSLQNGMKFKTKSDRDSRTVTVERL